MNICKWLKRTFWDKQNVNGNYNCTVFRNRECTKNGNKGTHFNQLKITKNIIC